ncbi:AMP-binding protein [Nitrosomonas sp. Is35]|uniref:class I adenylate-forming enzyme family protein n=1 Tax=Nitrosomonas sp. Is35 TaxID=3080534 RepID=UPI00294B3A22|nr:AMP-binding protein [Nitrosomonas sp. Is35]MDV6346469.1 AMP-binding protein [Nitrosomonas sp. Is35]
MKIPDFLYQSARRWPNNTAIVDEWGMVKYAELEALVRQIAANLKALNIAPHLGVAVMGKNSRYFIAQCFAVMECGAVVIPLSNEITTDEVHEIVKTTGLHAILADHTSKAHFDNTPDLIKLTYQDWRLFFFNNANKRIPFAAHVKNPAFVRFTSGTTSISKGAILSHESIAERTESANRVLQLGPADTITWVLSMAYHFVVTIILYLRYGSSIVICKNFMADTIIENSNRHKATLLYCSPLHIRLLINDQSGRKMPSLKYVISTSVSIAGAQCQMFSNRFDIPVSQAYGIIEIGLPILNFKRNKEYPDAIGYVLPDYQAQIINDQGSILPSEKTGNLVIRGPGMLDGYLDPPCSREDILRNGWFHTGDLASMDIDGLIRIAGRKKNMINVAGNKVFPEEVEAVLNQHPAIKLCRISGCMHNLLGEYVQAEVVLYNGEKKIDVEELITFCRDYLSPHKIPQKIDFVESLPMTYSQKLVRY